MEKFILPSNLQNFRPFLWSGAPVFFRYKQIYSYIQQNLGDECNVFAEPIKHQQEINKKGEPYWIINYMVAGESFNNLNYELQENLKIVVCKKLYLIKEHALKLSKSNNKSEQDLAELLSEASELPSFNCIYYDNGRFYITFWGFSNEDKTKPNINIYDYINLSPVIEDLKSEEEIIENEKKEEVPIIETNSDTNIENIIVNTVEIPKNEPIIENNKVENIEEIIEKNNIPNENKAGKKFNKKLIYIILGILLFLILGTILFFILKDLSLKREFSREKQEGLKAHATADSIFKAYKAKDTLDLLTAAEEIVGSYDIALKHYQKAIATGLKDSIPTINKQITDMQVNIDNLIKHCFKKTEIFMRAKYYEEALKIMEDANILKPNQPEIITKIDELKKLVKNKPQS